MMGALSGNNVLSESLAGYYRAPVLGSSIDLRAAPMLYTAMIPLYKEVNGHPSSGTMQLILTIRCPDGDDFTVSPIKGPACCLSQFNA